MFKRIITASAVICVFLLMAAVVGVHGDRTPATPSALHLAEGVTAPEQIIARWPDGYQLEYYPAATATAAPPSPSPTPAATTTPTHTATAEPAASATRTPVDTFTPSSTFTPTPTATATPRATQTPTATSTPPPTNTPRPTPTQEIRECWGRVISPVGVNVRAEPVIADNLYGKFAYDTDHRVYKILALTPEGDENRTEWGITEIDYNGEIVTAWVALWYQGSELVRLQDTPACWELPIERKETLINLCPGGHTITVQVDANDLRSALSALVAAGMCGSVKATDSRDYALIAQQYGGIGIERSVIFGDCIYTYPGQDPVQAATDRVNTIVQVLASPSAGIWAEPDNECTAYFDMGLDWLDAYYSTQIRLLSERGYTVVFGTQLAGAWTQARIQGLPLTWAAALRYGACFGMHQGSLPADFTDGVFYPSDQGRWFNWYRPFTANVAQVWRWRQQLNPAYNAIPICVTEWASRGAWGPFDPNEFAVWLVMQAGYGVRVADAFTLGVWNRPEWSVNGKLTPAVMEYIARFRAWFG